jgi:hypothetical protein
VDPDSEAYAEMVIDYLARLRDVAVITRPMREVLAREDAWVNKHGVKVPLHEIDQRYASNIVAFLERRAEVLHFGAMGEYLGWDCPFNGDMATLSWEQGMAEVMEASPEEWLSEQPMYRLIRNLAS